MRALPILVAGAVMVVGASLLPLQSAVADPGSVTITGVITGVGGAPVSTTVSWTSPATGASGDAVQSDATGAYSLAVPSNTSSFYVTANLSGLDPVTSGYVGEYAGAGGQVSTASQLIAPIATAAAATIDIPLTASGAIAGSVPALAGSSLSLETLGGAELDSVTVASSGAYSFASLVPGSYRLSYDESTSIYVAYASPAIVVQPGTTTTFNPKLVVGGRISGVVKSAGKPLKGIVVQASSGASNYKYVLTDSHGKYTIVGLPKAHYSVDAEDYSTHSTGYIGSVTKIGLLQPGKTKKLNLSLVRGGGITVTVDAPASATLQISIVKGRYRTLRFSSGKQPTNFPQLAPGHYTVYATQDGGTKYGSVTVPVHAGLVARVPHLKLTHKAVTLRGTVPGAKGGSVVVSNSAHAYFGAAMIKHGKYTITGLIPASYTATVSADGFLDRNTSVKAARSTRATTPKGAAVGIVTGTLTTGGVPLGASDAALTFSKADARFSYASLNGKGKFAAPLPAGKQPVEIDSYYEGFQSRSPYYLASPISSVTVKSGHTTALGTIAMKVLGGPAS